MLAIQRISVAGSVCGNWENQVSSGVTSVSQKMRGFAMHNDFTVFSRVVPSGKRVIYYYAYDEKGKRRGPWSTCQTSKTAGRNFVYRLLRSGRLIPGRGDAPTFAEYAKGWWEWETCPYLNDRKKRKNLTPSYAKRGKMVTANQLVPYFGNMRLYNVSSMK